MTFKIAVAQPIHDPVLKYLDGLGEVVVNETTEPWSREAMIERCLDAHALMAFMTERIDAEILDSCPHLKVVAGALKGYNNIDVSACSQRGIYVTVVPDLLTEPTAELAVGLMIATARNMVAGDQHIRAGKFRGWRSRFYGGSVLGANVVVVGAGAVGRAIMRLLSGFQCRLSYVDTKAMAPVDEARYGCTRATLAEALPQADFVILAVHLMDETKHLADRDFIARMRPGSYLINPARGSIVDEAAVVDALETGRLGGYAADTFEMEDWAREDRPNSMPRGLLTSDKTVLTPHIGSAVTQVREAIEMSAAKSIASVLQGRLPETAVNGDAVND